MRGWRPDDGRATGPHEAPECSFVDPTPVNGAEGPYLLVVDDQPSIRALVKCLLEIEGFRVTGAASSAEAMRVLSQVEVEMLITDIQMPAATGLELARAARVDRPDLPILLMSGAPPVLDFMETHCFFLEKPFTGADLVAKVRHALSVASG